MDQFSRRIIGFGVDSGTVDGVAPCRMLQRAIRGHNLPKYLSSDHDPLYRFHQWEANLPVLVMAVYNRAHRRARKPPASELVPRHMEVVKSRAS